VAQTRSSLWENGALTAPSVVFRGSCRLGTAVTPVLLSGQDPGYEEATYC